MEEQLNLFFKFLETEKKASKNTLQSYRRDLEQFEKYIQNLGKEFTKITDGKVSKIKYEENENGFIQIIVDGNYRVEVKYTGTNAMIISYILSFIFVLVLLFVSNYSKIKSQLNMNRR